MPYPLFVNLINKPCVVVGGGSVAEKRVEALVRHGALVRVVAPESTEQLQSLASKHMIIWTRATFVPEHLKGAFLVIAATNQREVNRKIAEEADRASMLVCVVDDPARGNYMTGASVERGDLTFAITTSGASPTLTSVIKQRIEKQFGQEWALLTNLLSGFRQDIQKIRTEQSRRTVVEKILEDTHITALLLAGQLGDAEEAAKKCILSHLD